MITFNGQQFLDEMSQRIDADARTIGQEVVKIAKSLTPVRSGLLRRSEAFAYDNVNHSLTFYSAAPYDIFVEYGTRHMRPTPHWRNALNHAKTIFGFETELLFGPPEIHAPMLVQGPRMLMPDTLTRGQRWHVREHVLPGLKAKHVGNVSRAKLTVRRGGQF